MKHKDGWPFDRPITKQDAPDYHLCVKTPIDLSTIRFAIFAAWDNLDLTHRSSFGTICHQYSSFKDSTGWHHLLHKKPGDSGRHQTCLFQLRAGKILLGILNPLAFPKYFKCRKVGFGKKRNTIGWSYGAAIHANFSFCSTTRRTQMSTSVQWDWRSISTRSWAELAWLMRANIPRWKS